MKHYRLSLPLIALCLAAAHPAWAIRPLGPPKATAKKAAGAKKFSKCQKKTMKSMFNMTQIKCFPSG